MRIIFVGPPGVGKGTQSARLVSYLGIPHISTGEMLRKAIAADTPVGRIAHAHISKGKLAPDAVVLDLIAERLSQSDCERGYLLDGFPRTLAQAEAFDTFLRDRRSPLSAVLELKVGKDQLLERLASRKRVDDRPEIIRERLESYIVQTTPLINYYCGRGLLHEIDGIGTPDEVFERIKRVLASINANGVTHRSPGSRPKGAHPGFEIKNGP